MSPHLLALAKRLIDRGGMEPFFTLSEGLVKVRTLEAALDLGWVVQEGAPSPGSAYAITKTVNGVEVVKSLRRLSVADGSADLYITQPIELMLEIKTRPDIGTKAQAGFQQMKLDVRRVSQHKSMALLFLFDRGMYGSFCGENKDGRGRPSVEKDWFTNLFPSHPDVVAVSDVTVEASADGAPLSLWFCAMPNPIGPKRILVLGARTDALF
jgi:hypothetical protein